MDSSLFREAYAELCRRHGALRTVIEQNVAGEVVCRVLDEGVLPGCTTLDARPEEGETPDAWLARWSRARVTAPFSKEDPAVDSCLVTLGPRDHYWFFSQHHAVADAWSTSLAFEQLSLIYAQLEAGDPAADAPARDYVDFLAFEEKSEGTSSFRRAQEYWTAQQDGTDGNASVGFYGDRSGRRAGARRRSTRTERLECRLGPTRSRRVRELSETGAFRGLSPDVSCFHVFATAMFALLRRVGDGARDLTLLTPVHGRPTRAFKETLGVFIEVLPLDLRVDAADSFADLGQKVRTSMRGLVGHALPGISAHVPARIGADAVLNYIPSSFDGGFAGRPAEAEWLHPGHGDPEHALRLQVHDFGGSGEFVLHFDAHCDVFGPGERSAVVRHFLALLDALLGDPGARVSEVPLMDAEALTLRAAALDRCAAQAPQGADGPTILDDFAAQVKARPGSVALRSVALGSGALGSGAPRSGESALTYGELDEEANQFAGALGAHGVGPGDLVALALPRSVDLVALMLATLRLGAAYLPLDPGLPAARQALTLGLAAPKLVVFDIEFGPESGPGAEDAQRASVDDLRAAAGEFHPRTQPAPHDRAYVIFTSGSTGVPKGVEVPHSALANYVRWAAATYTRGEPKSFPLFSPASVDLSITSIFVPLCSGGTIVVYPEERSGTDLTIFEVFDDDHCDAIKLTPAHLALLVQRGPISAQRLDTLIVGGEDLRRGLARRVQDELGPDVAIYNEYGPTEAAVGCMIHRFDLEETADESVPIGRPIDGVRIHLVNEADQPVPNGVPGEILIGGECLAKGYLGAHELTAERFTEDPVLKGGSTVYRTGDLARISPATGALTFLGRRDDQVKVRGVRIELGEVETALESLPEIQACAVTVESLATSHPGEKSDRTVLSVAGDPRWEGVTHCVRCGLASNHPEAKMEGRADGVCAVCLEFDTYRDAAQSYFGTPDELRAKLDRGRALAQKNGSDFDCLALLSGGKDSTYALYQLVELGYRPLVFSLDNGYIAEGAKANIRRVVEHLGLELVFQGTGATSSMNAIFADSLDRFSNVCQGCFKTIYTLATQVAQERGIQTIVTGLSRGQIFETRLAPIFRSGIRDVAEVDRFVIDARKTYHRVDDAVARHLDVSTFAGDEVFEEIQFVDFYRYWDVPLSEVLGFIAKNAAWERPADTGRSTNCLINDVGIAVHKRERGFHNYALPYSWDVRLGHKTRDECLDELNDEIDEERVQRILREVGADTSSRALTDERRLVAHYVLTPGAPAGTGALELRAALLGLLPDAMVPQAFVRLGALPLTAAGKVDRAGLVAPEGSRESGPAGAAHVGPQSELEQTLADIWSGVLHVEKIGIHDHFLDLGGDSILGIQMVARARAAGWKIAPREVFTHPTIAQLAQVAQRLDAVAGGPCEAKISGHGQPLGEAPITPMQSFGLRTNGAAPGVFGMSVVMESVTGVPLDETALGSALGAVARHHDALRTSFTGGANRGSHGGWVQEVLPPAPSNVPFLDVHEARSAGATENLEEKLHGRFDLGAGRLLAAALVRGGDGQPDQLLVAVHHLVMDAVSWEPLLTDLDSAYGSALERAGAVAPPGLPPRSAPWRSWARYLRDADGSGALEPLRDRWSQVIQGTEGTAQRLGRMEQETSVSVGLGEEATARARSLGAADALLAAFAVSLGPADARGPRRIDVETHGRADLPIHDPAPDVSRTLGWFTAMAPVRIGPGSDPMDALAHVREHRRRAADTEAAFGYLFPGELGKGEALFNYLGTQGAPVRIVAQGSAPHLQCVRGVRLVRSAASPSTHPVSVHVVEDEGGALEVTATFAAMDHGCGADQGLLARMEAALLAMTAPGAPDPGPASNGPHGNSHGDTGLSPEDLEDLLEDYG